MATTTPCSTNTPIEAWQSCSTTSNCFTLVNIQNVEPVDPGMFNWTFNYDQSTGVLAKVVILVPSPIWIPMASRTNPTFGTIMDSNWEWTSVPTIVGLANSIGWYKLNYTNQFTKITSSVGVTVMNTTTQPPILTVHDTAITAYFSYVPPTATNPGRILCLTYVDSTNTQTDSNGRSYPAVAYPATPTTAPSIFDISDLDGATSITSGTSLGIYTYISNTQPTTTDILSMRIANPTQPTTSGGDTANNIPHDTNLSSLTPSCVVTTPASNNNLFPIAPNALKNNKNHKILTIIFIIVMVVVVIITIIVTIIIIISTNKQKNKTNDLRSQIKSKNAATTAVVNSKNTATTTTVKS